MTESNTVFIRWMNGKLYPNCRECRRIRLKARRNRLGINARKRIDGSYFPSAKSLRQNWKRRYPEKNAAHVLVGRALKTGKLQKEPCLVCNTTENIQAHHHNGYSKPHRLDVIWLCREHHDGLHKYEMNL